MALIYDFIPPIETEYIPINYDFYKEYLQNNKFNDIFKQRVSYIKSKYGTNMTDKELIEEYFVELFSWSVIPEELLLDISNFLLKNNITRILDPCCGNAFHTCLFDMICDINTLSCDIQREENAWIETLEQDGRQFLDELNEQDHFEGALILSWIDGEKLAKELLSKFKGNIIISIGNYVINTDYIDDLKRHYKLKKQIILKMPWGLNERIEIYSK